MYYFKQPAQIAARFILPAILFTSCISKEKPVTRDEAIQFAHTMEKWVKADSAEKMNNIFDKQVFIKRVTQEAGASLNKSLLQGASEGFSHMNFGNQIIRSLDKKGSYLLVKEYEKDHIQHLIFRLYGDSKVNYHDYELIKKDNKIKVADIFIYITGENLSASLAHALLMINEDLDDLSEKEKNEVR